jgi:membrane associated rhomboid family serine protease
MSQPDLFVVCKNCGSEVSPYVTECPYCGQRVRKRAPKIDRGGEEAASGKRGPRLSRLRPDEIEGIAPDRRPYATMALVLVSLAATVVVQAGVALNDVGAVLLPVDDSVWRWFASPFVYDSLGYEFVTLVAAALFGSLLERRHGPVAALAIFVLSGAAGCALAVGVDAPALFTNDPLTPVLGANGAALGLVTAWLVDDRLAARRGEDRGNDMLGVAVFAAVLLLLSVAVKEANIAAAAGGAVAGALLGVTLPLFTRRRAAY